MARLQVALDHVVEKLVVHLALHVQDEEEAKLVLSSAPDPWFRAQGKGFRVCDISEFYITFEPRPPISQI